MGKIQTDGVVTARQTEVLELIAEGLKDAQVAQKLGIGIPTVRRHVADLLDRLGADNRANAVALAFRARVLAVEGDVPPEAEDFKGAVDLLEYALTLRMYGERAPGGNETWTEFDRRCEVFLRGLPASAWHGTPPKTS